jgi:hypothetical protein
MWRMPERGAMWFGVQFYPRERGRYEWSAVLLGITGCVRWPVQVIRINGQWFAGLRWPLILRVWTDYREWKALA